jgi:diguanylate cyclase (GGDEF)-like protein
LIPNILKNLYDVIIIIDKKDGTIETSYSVDDFKEFPLRTREDFELFFEHFFPKHTPIFKAFSYHEKRYWVQRKTTQNEIIYLIKECSHLDGILQEVNKNATLDGLTQCNNKTEILTIIKQMLQTSLRYKDIYFSLLMIDIDYFKKVNDTYGHLMGDFILQKLALLFEDRLRECDICGRFGGEEFIIILPQTKLVGALKLAEYLRNEVQQHSFVKNNTKIHITISVGATAVSLSDSPEALIERCDTALYDAKKAGRNRVEYR